MQEERNEKLNIAKKRGGWRKAGAGKLTLGLGASALVLIITAAIALTAIASLAWISGSRMADAEDIQMELDDDLFELRVSASAPGASAWPNGWDDLGYTNPSASGGLLQTSKNGRILRLQMIPAGLDAIHKPEEEELGPNTRGTLAFTFVPSRELLDTMNSGDSLNITVRMELRAYGASGAQITTGNALNYINGHILFFDAPSGETDGTPNGLFTSGDFPTDGTFTYTVPKADLINSNNNNNEITGKELTIHWVWPRVLRQLLYADQSRAQDKLLEASGVTEMRSRILAHPNQFFKNGPTVSNDGELDLYREELSTAYNLADQEVGDSIRYVAAIMTVSAAVVQP